jgi:hypothetical protein
VPAENVVHIINPVYQPAVQYHSMPRGYRGGVYTLQESRSSFRSVLADRMSLIEQDLPPVIEHQERLIANV